MLREEDYLEKLTELIGEPYPKPYKSQRHISIQYGYAYCQWRRNDHEVFLTLLSRKEGQGELSIAQLPNRQTFAMPQEVEKMAEAIREVLATGRTLECGKGVNLPALDSEMTGSPVSVSWEIVREMVLGVPEGKKTRWSEKQVNLDPPYQREHVWTELQQRRFLGHCLEGGRTLPVYIYRSEDFRGEDYLLRQEVVDGKQRMTAIALFIAGEIPAEVYAEGAWRELWYKDFNEIDRRSRRMNLEIFYGDWPYAERLTFYLRLNSGGSVHTQEELDRVRKLLVEAEKG